MKVSGYLGSCPRYDSCSLWGSSVFLSGVARPGDDCVVTLLHGRSEINIKPPSAELIDKNISPVCPSLPGCCKCSKGSHKGEPTYLGPWIAVRPVRGKDVARIRISFTSRSTTVPNQKQLKSLGFKQGYLTSLMHPVWFAYFSFRFLLSLRYTHGPVHDVHGVSPMWA